MKGLLELAKLQELTLVIPFVIVGIAFILEGLFFLRKAWKKQESKYVQHSGMAAILLMITGVCWILCNLLFLIIPIAAWLIATVLLLSREKKSGMTPDQTRNRCIPWFPKKTKKRVIVNILCIVFVIGCLIPYICAGYVYQLFFGVRYETSDMYRFRVSDFDGLCCEEVRFPSNKGQMLAGYLYSYETEEPQRGVVVMGHGFGGGGQNSYMPCMNYFAKQGYYVFAYDATGNDNSEGNEVIGLPQQIIDMDYAISYVEQAKKTENLPIVLWGHSWGGYTVTNELNYHPEVKAVISVAGFNSSIDLMEAWGLQYAGATIYYILPYMELHQRLLCGKVSNSSAEKGFEVSNAGVMVISAENDPVVPTEYGYDLWYENYSDNPRFKFKRISGLAEDFAHNNVFCSEEYNEWSYQFNKVEFKEWVETLGYDYEDKAYQEQFIKDKTERLNQPYVREARANRVDEDLFGEMLAFFDEYIK